MVGDHELKVSVIMPVYNAEEFLESSVRSVINQTLKEIEIICIDDGSTDSSPLILRSLSESDRRIKIITRKKQDAGAARNCGITEARGKYLSFLDADDFFEPDMLEEAYLAAEKNQAELVVFRGDSYNSGTGRFQDTGWTIKESCIPLKSVFSGLEVKDLFNAFSGWAWDKLYLRDYIVDNRLKFQEQRIINDRLFVESAFAKAGRINILNKVLIHKRINHVNALTTGYFSGDNWKYWLSAISAIQRWLKEEGLYDAHKRNFVSFAVKSILWNLDKFIGTEGFDGLFEYLKTGYLEGLGICEEGKELFYDFNDYELFQFFKNHSKEQYIFCRNLCKKDGSYLFPFELVPRNSRIVLFGAGSVGNSFYRQIAFSGWCEVVEWVDSKPAELGPLVKKPDCIKMRDVDLVVIAINSEETAGQIMQNLIKQGVPKESIIWKKYEVEIKSPGDMFDEEH